MALQPTDLLDLVGDLHEGVADPYCWKRGLDRLSDMFGDSRILLGTFHQGNSGFNLIGHRVTTAAVEQIAGPFANARDNPWVAAAWSAPLRQIQTIADVGEERLHQSRVWQAIYVAGGMQDSVGTVLDRAPGHAEVFLLTRAQGVYDAADRALLDQLVPHVARAWRVRRAIERWQDRGADMAAALDRLERGVVVTDAGGAVRYANRAAERLLGDGNTIDATRGRLRATRPADTAALAAMIDRATHTGIGRDAAAVGALALPRDDEAPLAVVAEPLAPAHGDRLGQTRGHGAILFLSDAAASSRPSPERLQSVYGLTGAEAQVAARVVDGDGLAAAAKAVGISENTAKTHLKAVFGKVGVTRQAQLVRRVIADVGGLADESLHGARRP